MTDKIEFFCNVLMQAPHLDMVALDAEMEHFGIDPKELTIADLMAAFARAPRIDARRSEETLREVAGHNRTQSKKLGELARQGWEVFGDGMRLKAEVKNALENLERSRKPRATRQKEPLSDEDTDEIVLEALRHAGGGSDWVLAEKIRAFGYAVTIRRDALARLCSRGAVEKIGRNRGTKYRVKIASLVDKPNGSVVVRKAKAKKITPPRAQA